MQKETEILNDSKNNEAVVPRATSENTPSNSGDGSADTLALENETTKSENQVENNLSDASDFEELIKGPYKDAFAKKVQSIINKRFKEQKTAENKSAGGEALETKSEAPTETTQKGDSFAAENDPAYANLLNAGVDPETAYRVLHLNEFMDSSMRYGAELAAKQIADSIRLKSARPSESALSGKSYVAKTSVTTLTPQKRRELAKKALMGEEIGF